MLWLEVIRTICIGGIFVLIVSSVVERVVATVQLSTYENNKSNAFFIGSAIMQATAPSLCAYLIFYRKNLKILSNDKNFYESQGRTFTVCHI